MHNKISPRQVQLIQGSATILMEILFLSKEEAIAVISESLKEELKASNVNFEYLELGSLSNRQVFIRNLVYRVEKKLETVARVSKDKIKQAIEKFVKLFYDLSKQ